MYYNKAMTFDYDYWADSDAEECTVREKARKLGIPKRDVENLLRKHPDAFEIRDRDLERLARKHRDDDWD